MTRMHLAVTPLSVALAFVVVSTFFTAPAHACISCNYTPEVVNTPVGKAPKAKKMAKPERVAPPPKKHIAKKRPPADPAPVAKAEPQKDVATGAAPASAPAELETAAVPPSSATAALNAQAGRAPEPAPEVGCKKFSATAGTTVTVPCE